MSQSSTPELSVIIPYYGEYPHIHYTLQSVWTELGDMVDFEVILVDNDPRTPSQNERTLRVLTDDWKRTPWIRFVKYTDKPSNWGARNCGVRHTKGEYLLFLDAHSLISPGSVLSMYQNYRTLNNGDYVTHLPISDFFSPTWKEYEILYDPQRGILHHGNVPYRRSDFPRTVPASPACGLLCRRDHITEDLEYWPDELGQYGGGENYFNWVMALLGRKILIHPKTPIYHWHIPREWSRDHVPTPLSWAVNILIATYLLGGEDWAARLVRHAPETFYPVNSVPHDKLHGALMEILKTEPLRERRERLLSRAITTVDNLGDWVKQWEVAA